MPSKTKSVEQAPRRFLRLREVLEITGLKHTTIYKLIDEDRFPRQVQVSDRAVAWVESEVNDFMVARIAERDEAAA